MIRNEFLINKVNQRVILYEIFYLGVSSMAIPLKNIIL